MIYFDKVSKVYPDKSVALDGVSFTIEPKEFVTIVGHSGAGKTTLMKMLIADKSLGDRHYPLSRTEFVEGLGKRTLESYAEQGIDVQKEFGHTDPHKIGEQVRKWLVDYLTSGPVVAVVLEGPHAIEMVRKFVGNTMPVKAQPGTIRGDYSFDSSAYANQNRRPIRNLIHASGNKEEAEFEINLWFKPQEMFQYDSVHQRHMTA